MSNEICAVCSCDIALLPKKSKPVRHAGKVYCGECARLILDPDTDRGSEEIEVPDPDFEDIERIPDAKAMEGKTVVAGKIEVVEEYNIKAVGSPPAQNRERKLDDDDWFKQANTKPGPVSNTAVAVREKRGGTSISKRAEAAAPAERSAPKRSNSGRMDSAKPSGRMPAAKPSGRMDAVKPSAPSKPVSARNIPAAAPKQREPEPEELEEVEDAPPPVKSTKSPSRRMERSTAKPSGRMAKATPGSRSKMTPVSKKEAPLSDASDEPEEVMADALPEVEEADELAPVEAESKKSDSKRAIVAAPARNSSRRMKAAKRSGGSGAGGNSKSVRGERGERDRDEREERGRGKSRSGGDNTQMMMIGGAVVVILLLVVALAASGGKEKPEAKKQAQPEMMGTSSSELARQAAVLEANGDKAGAADLYGRAAEACTNNEQAQQYNMRAYQIRKFTVLPMH